ncbi:hypothetical protein [Hymenobacter lucidus]|uniref:Exo-alpha-sialidase n=1 Tax=Hymenobacter lucidus TaxID=2880930 RepID=A0ABS8AVV3_9BACT|nr:hypothetical protein [Hymenobacter lucidus]MCB2409749.1 hypothetical protein [Hymenobacter lucidus]
MPAITTLGRFCSLLLLLTAACSPDNEPPAPVTSTSTFEKVIPLRSANVTATDITELYGGTLFVLGQVSGPNGAQAALLARLTATGDTVWTRRYSLDPTTSQTSAFGYQIVPTIASTDDQIVLFGRMTTPSTGTQLVVQQIIVATGEIMWSTVIPSTNPYHTCKVVRTNAGGYMVVTTSNQAHRFTLCRLSRTGAIEFTTTLPGDVPTSICMVKSSSNFFANTYGIAGVNDPLGKQEPFLSEVTENGAVLWSEVQTGLHFSLNNTLVPLGYSGFALFSGPDPAGEQPIQLLRTDNNGRKISSIVVAPDIKGFVNRIAVTPDNNLVMVGAQTEKTSTGTAYHPLVLRLSLAGVELSRQTKPTVSGTVASVFKTLYGELIFCSTEANRLVVRRTNPDLTQ